MRSMGWGVVALLLTWAGAGASQAATPSKQRWLPNAEGASWTYGWYDNTYNNKVTLERYSVVGRTDASVRLQWTTEDAGNEEGHVPSAGIIDYVYSETGLANSTWSSTPPPSNFPVLCASAAECGNSLAGSHYHFIWGSRSTLLQEPLVRGATWQSTGGQANDVAGVNRYLGTERVVVPAFPLGIMAAKVETDITQAGSLGDTYGTGLRTTWWVYGVGPVKSVFRHAGGELSEVALHATTLTPRRAPSDKARFPLRRGDVQRYRFTNTRYLKRPSVQRLVVGDTAGGTARIDAKHERGPLRFAGTYLFGSNLKGVRMLQGGTRAVPVRGFPKLGPRGAKVRRRLDTPLDFITFGFNPVMPAYPVKGQTWRAPKVGRDRRNYGVDGRSKVIGNQKVKVPAGTFTALLIESRLTQKGYRFGSGTRRMWFAPGVGLVKLEFRHRDGSVSRIVRLPKAR